MNRFSKKLVVLFIVCIIVSSSLFARPYRRTSWVRPYISPIVTTVRYSTPEVFVYTPYTINQPVVYTNPVYSSPVYTTPTIYTNPLYVNNPTYTVAPQKPVVYNNVTNNISTPDSKINNTSSSQNNTITKFVYKSNIADVEFKDGKVNVIISSSKPLNDKNLTVTLSTADSSVSENITLQSGVSKNLGNDMYMITFLIPDSLKNFVNKNNYKISFTGKIDENSSISGTKSVLNIVK